MSLRAWLGGLLFRCDFHENGDGTVTFCMAPRLPFLPHIGPITLNRHAPGEVNSMAVKDGVRSAFDKWGVS